MNLIKSWFHRHLSDPQLVILAVLIVIGSMAILFLGRMLAPVLASLVIAYLLEGPINVLEKRRIPRLICVLIVFLGFVIFLFFLLLGLFPMLWRQAGQLFKELPSMISWSQQALLHLPERYPDLISEKQVVGLISSLRSELAMVGQQILSLSIASVRAVIWILVYTVLMPLLVFFFLKDKDRLMNWLKGFLPHDRKLANEVWHDVDRQIGNYIRGKVWEILIVWAASYITFTILGLQFAILISLFVGLSVLIPYIGAVSMTFPVASIAYFQWGLSPEFTYVVIAYVIIQILDGNVLVTLLFSEVVNMHPIAIIVAVLIFGGFFGFWGVFFAIPLATLVRAVLKAWTERRKMADLKDAQKAANEA